MLFYSLLHHDDVALCPTAIGQLTNLRELRIPNNKLTTLPHEIGQLHRLHRLVADNNQLTALPGYISCQISQALHYSCCELS